MVNHGVSSAFLEKVKKEVHEFFNLRMEEKKKYWQRPEDLEGFGQAYVLSEEQKFVWGDGFIMTTLPVNLRKPHLFPKLPLPLRDTLEAYSMELKSLAMNLILKMGKPEKVVGLTPHSDGCGLTILLQINEVEGLQIKKDGMWIPLTPLPNAFLVNVGDIMEKDSLLAHFTTRDMMVKYYPASSLISEKAPALFRRLTVEEYLSGRFARELRGKSYLDVLRIQHGQG
ncbi:hypothetical protein WN944_014438 [Citrus x changshan-huyou]|uniref:Uncharacterized protein n=1 Tax=Citrus x changshan-huyou TaxID=2935761 RepID=A0AAP0QLP2_9ROSI